MTSRQKLSRQRILCMVVFWGEYVGRDSIHVRFGSVGLYLQGSLLHPRYDFQAVGQHGSPFEMLKFLWLFCACLSHWTWRRWFSCFSFLYYMLRSWVWKRDLVLGKSLGQGLCSYRTHISGTRRLYGPHNDLMMDCALCFFLICPGISYCWSTSFFWYQHINSCIFWDWAMNHVLLVNGQLGDDLFSDTAIDHESCCSLLIINIYICMYVCIHWYFL